VNGVVGSVVDSVVDSVVGSIVELLRRRDVRILLVASFVVGVCMGFVSGLPDYIVEAESFGVIEHPAMESSGIDPTPVDVERVVFIRRYSHLLDGEVLGVIVDESRKYGIDPRLIMAQIEVESTFNPRAVSKAGARGLMQIMPDTGRQLARELGFTDYDLFDPVTNVRMGIYYMSKLIRRFGDYDTALSAYFWGQTRVARDVSSYRSTEYSRKVMNASVNYR
jgi:soluble lytic murein transglycosylase-like protein